MKKVIYFWRSPNFLVLFSLVLTQSPELMLKFEQAKTTKKKKMNMKSAASVTQSVKSVVTIGYKVLFCQAFSL